MATKALESIATKARCLTRRMAICMCSIYENAAKRTRQPQPILKVCA